MNFVQRGAWGLSENEDSKGTKNLWGTSKLLFKVFVLLYTPIINEELFPLLYIVANMCYLLSFSY